MNENFVDLSGFGDRYEAIAVDMRATVRQVTGIPNCVGIAETKTLAKLANFAAKKNPIFGGVCDFTQPAVLAWCLDRIPVAEVWENRAANTNQAGITRNSNGGTVARHAAHTCTSARYSCLRRTVAELQGHPLP